MRLSLGGGLAMVAALVLSACAMRPEPPPIEQFASWTDIIPQTTFIGGGPDGAPADLNSFLANEESLRQALDTLFPEVAAVPNLGERIARIREPLKDPEPASAGRRQESSVLRGLGGTIANAFLDAAEATLDRNGNFDPTKRVYQFVYGKILDFKYNDSDGSGAFYTVTYYTTVTIPFGRSPILSRTDAYRWTIEVGAGGFRVVPKSHADPNDPFPGTMEFSPAMLNRIEFLGFRYKLWAEGTIIDIVNVEHKADGSPDFVALPRSDWRYDRTAENCIDMLFVNYPAAMLGTLKPPLYCLGRCKTPQLVNTNAD